MRIEKINNLNSEKFRRLVDIKRVTFNKMLTILKEAEVKKKYYGGAPNKLLLENRILMTLVRILTWISYIFSYWTNLWN